MLIFCSSYLIVHFTTSDTVHQIIGSFALLWVDQIARESRTHIVNIPLLRIVCICRHAVAVDVTLISHDYSIYIYLAFKPLILAGLNSLP